MLTNHLSTSEHISDVICRCAQSLYAIKVLRCHGMNETHFKDSCAALLRFYMQPQLGGGLPQLLIGNELRHCLSLCAAWSLPGKRPNPDAAHCWQWPQPLQKNVIQLTLWWRVGATCYWLQYAATNSWSSLKPILLPIQWLLLIGQSAPNSKWSTNFCLAPKYRFAINLVAAPKHHAATNSESCY